MASTDASELLERYEVLENIGQGNFGMVDLCRSRVDGELCVLKRVNLRGLKPAEAQGALQEAELLSQLDHPCIVGYKESAYLEKTSTLFIVMEYCDGGDLATVITEQEENEELLPEDQILFWFTQLAMAIRYIHSKNILHRDLKTQNIFLTKERNHIKLGDFGISKVLNSDTDFARTAIGTPFYLSPEICEGKTYGKKSDMWSLGCILYEMTTLKHAFNGRNLPALVLKILRGNYPPVPDQYSLTLRKLVDSLLQQNPKKRPTIVEVLQQPFAQQTIASFEADDEEEDEYESDFETDEEDYDPEEAIEEEDLETLHRRIVSENYDDSDSDDGSIKTERPHGWTSEIEGQLDLIQGELNARQQAKTPRQRRFEKPKVQRRSSKSSSRSSGRKTPSSTSKIRAKSGKRVPSARPTPVKKTPAKPQRQSYQTPSKPSRPRVTKVKSKLFETPAHKQPTKKHAPLVRRTVPSTAPPRPTKPRMKSGGRKPTQAPPLPKAQLDLELSRRIDNAKSVVNAKLSGREKKRIQSLKANRAQRKAEEEAEAKRQLARHKASLRNPKSKFDRSKISAGFFAANVAADEIVVKEPPRSRSDILAQNELAETVALKPPETKSEPEPDVLDQTESANGLAFVVPVDSSAKRRKKRKKRRAAEKEEESKRESMMKPRSLKDFVRQRKKVLKKKQQQRNDDIEVDIKLSEKQVEMLGHETVEDDVEEEETENTRQHRLDHQLTVLRKQCVDMLGERLFNDVLTFLRSRDQNADDDETDQQMGVMLTPQQLPAVRLVNQYLFCEGRK